MKEQQCSEIAVSLVGPADVERTPDLLDGYRLCAGCMDVFVLAGYCANCSRMLLKLELQRFYRDVDAEHERRKFRLTEQTDMGIVPYHPPFDERDEHTPAPPWAVWVVLGAAVVVTMFALTGLWFMGRGLIGFGLEHSK